MEEPYASERQWGGEEVTAAVVAPPTQKAEGETLEIQIQKYPRPLRAGLRLFMPQRPRPQPLLSNPTCTNDQA